MNNLLSPTRLRTRPGTDESFVIPNIPTSSVLFIPNAEAFRLLHVMVGLDMFCFDKGTGTFIPYETDKVGFEQLGSLLGLDREGLSSLLAELTGIGLLELYPREGSSELVVTEYPLTDLPVAVSIAVKDPEAIRLAAILSGMSELGLSTWLTPGIKGRQLSKMTLSLLLGLSVEQLENCFERVKDLGVFDAEIWTGVEQ